MAIVDATRVTLPATGGKIPPGWAKACFAVFALDGARAARMFESLPLIVPLAGGAPARERALIAFGRTGLTLETARDSVRGEPCGAHPRVIVTETCPKCRERTACVLCICAEPASLCLNCRGRARFFARFKWLRVSILLAVLSVVLYTTYVTKWRLQSWTRPIVVAVYPVRAERSAALDAWTDGLRESDFADVEAFILREGKRHGIEHERLIEIRLAPAFAGDLPPDPPKDGSALSIAAWSFRLRAWSWSTRRAHHLPPGDVEVYVLYHAEADTERSLDRSLAVEKMRVGVVHAFAGRNNAKWTSLALAHELLHTVGASDKYEANGTPVFPEGYAEPLKDPLVPQRFCEVMAGEIALSSKSFRPATTLDECVVGTKTATEIGWIKL